jgi:hypothetical protein
LRACHPARRAKQHDEDAQHDERWIAGQEKSQVTPLVASEWHIEKIREKHDGCERQEEPDVLRGAAADPRREEREEDKRLPLDEPAGIPIEIRNDVRPGKEDADVVSGLERRSVQVIVHERNGQTAGYGTDCKAHDTVDA